MLNKDNVTKLLDIAKKTINTAVIRDLKYEDGNLTFNTHSGEAATKKICEALADAGLQHTLDDGKGEFFISGSDGASLMNVRWPMSDKKPMWMNQDI